MSSEAWRTSDRNEMKMGLGTARAHNGADAASIKGAGMRIAAVDGSKVQSNQKQKREAAVLFIIIIIIIITFVGSTRSFSR